MPGGSLNSIQDLDVEDAIQNEARHEELTWVTEALVAYGELSRPARNATGHLLAKLQSAHDTYLKLIDEAQQLVNPLRPVWRAVDFEGSNDISREDVCKVLEEYNRTYGKRTD